MEQVIIEQHEGWVKLTLNRPEAKNALNTAVLARVAEGLTAAAADPTVRAALICGADGTFAAGADIAEIEGKTAAEGARDPRKAHRAAIRAFPKPLVAAVDGFALGGGFELALMADMMVLGADARLGLPETNLGLIPGAGGAQRLLALAGRAWATRMVLGGEIIDAATAYDWGIAGWLATGPALPDPQARRPMRGAALSHPHRVTARMKHTLKRGGSTIASGRIEAPGPGRRNQGQGIG